MTSAIEDAIRIAEDQIDRDIAAASAADSDPFSAESIRLNQASSAMSRARRIVNVMGKIEAAYDDLADAMAVWHMGKAERMQLKPALLRMGDCQDLLAQALGQILEDHNVEIPWEDDLEDDEPTARFSRPADG